MSGTADRATGKAARQSWQELEVRARAWRLVHAAWSVAQLGALGYIWACVARRRRDRRLWASVTFLVAEGVALAIGRGDCPMGRLQQQWGDPVPLFELVLPSRLAKAAVPALALLSIAAMAGIVLRPPAPAEILQPGARRHAPALSDMLPPDDLSMRDEERAPRAHVAGGGGQRRLEWIGETEGSPPPGHPAGVPMKIRRG